MKQFIIFVKKEFYHIFRDRKSLLIIFLMPIVQIILFGFALTNEIKNSNIAVLDNSKDKATVVITQRLNASRYFKVYETIVPDRERIKKIIEVGIGSNDRKSVGYMGDNYRIGASLRLLRDFFPKAQVVGIDIDPGLMFRETCIKTFVVDQLDVYALNNFVVGSGFFFKSLFSYFFLSLS